MRNGLTYQQSSDNSNRKARVVFAKAIEQGKSIAQAAELAREEYEKEMKWYEE